MTTRVYWNGSTPWVKLREPGQSEMDLPDAQLVLLHLDLRDHIVEQHIHKHGRRQLAKGSYPIKANGHGRLPACAKAQGLRRNVRHHAVEFEYADGSRMFSHCRHIPGCWNSVSEHAQGTKGNREHQRCDDHAPRNRFGFSWHYSARSPTRTRSSTTNLFCQHPRRNPINEGESGAKSSMTAILGRMCT